MAKESSKVDNKPGRYVHKESGAVLVALSAPQADALVRQGFVYETKKADKK